MGEPALCLVVIDSSDSRSAHGGTVSEFSALSDDELRDIGMHRCACGEAVYPNGIDAPHCEQDKN